MDLAGATWVAHGEPLTPVTRTLLVDVLEALEASSVVTPDKLEGLGITGDGDAWMVTDNDGLDDAIGQTVFLPGDLPTGS